LGLQCRLIGECLFGDAAEEEEMYGAQ